VKIRVLEGVLEGLKCERGFEEGFMRLVRGQYHSEQVYGGTFFNEWGGFLCWGLGFLIVLTYCCFSHAVMSYTPEILTTIKQAWQGKIPNKPWELEHERQDEVLGHTIQCRNKGPPAYVLTRLSDDSEERHLDKVARSSISEVGYVRLVKLWLGFRLRDLELAVVLLSGGC
jgi:hypothetical protein